MAAGVRFLPGNNRVKCGPIQRAHCELSQSDSTRNSAFEQFKNSGGYTTEMSSIVVTGLSTHTSPVEMHEKLSIQKLNDHELLDDVLSTCNCIEIYV
ncbi:hypothetical protein HID58_016251 [Brassica napus]|uniref:Uncharacterized protein n=2 Tax=Brassica napus TaxID=3708 RepID=A0ABQ8DMD1_BRANA|nr:hypothetical protein HID58_016251 [Brassica napus]